MTDIWLNLPETLFNDLPDSKEWIWLTIVEKNNIKQIIQIGNRKEFSLKWNLLAFYFSSPLTRARLSLIGNNISSKLFPEQKNADKIVIDRTLEEIYEDNNKEQVSKKSRKIYEQVKKQIKSIAQAVSEGHDAKAEIFLRQLIKEQISFSGGEDLAVKSLCNIAQQCADMFRVDFEYICLEEANKLNPSDTWLLIQFGDYFKRIENHEEALKFFSKAKKLGDRIVAESSIADVYSQQGDYEKAILTYKSIANWEDIPTVQTAIADNMRKMGLFEEAKVAYENLIFSFKYKYQDTPVSSIRAYAGLAEIAKRQGKLDVALDRYKEIAYQEEIDYQSRIIYKLSYCNILKLMERYNDAYLIADEVIQEFPFAMTARFARGSILGLIGKENEGLNDLPESNSNRSVREWLRYFYRGLLLFKLKRFDDARKNLVEEFQKAIVSGEEKTILRMAAALWFLKEGDTTQADKLLSEITPLYDYHAQYLSLVLKLHSATQKQDLEKIKSLIDTIDNHKIIDSGLDKAVEALKKGDFNMALIYESDALLKLAA